MNSKPEEADLVHDCIQFNQKVIDLCEIEASLKSAIEDARVRVITLKALVEGARASGRAVMNRRQETRGGELGPSSETPSRAGADWELEEQKSALGKAVAYLDELEEQLRLVVEQRVEAETEAERCHSQLLADEEN